MGGCLLFVIELTGEPCNELKGSLYFAIWNEECNTVLLSGGLDSTIITAIRKPENSITVGFGAEAADIKFAKIAARKFVRNQIIRNLSIQEILRLIDDVIVTLKTFDPITIRNAVVPYAGMEVAKSAGLDRVYTGDGADEVFAGYNFLRRYLGDMKRLEKEISRLRTIMTFPSFNIGKRLNVKIVTPFLNDNVIRIAKMLPVSKLVGLYGDRVWGKMVLRRCYRNELGEDFSWRVKLAQEEGAGITSIREILSNIYTDSRFTDEVRQAEHHGIIIRDKEHLHYYKSFIRNFSVDAMQECSELKCPGCGNCVSIISNYCRLCGLHPVHENNY
jgi:asparagine synthase (glutamine-hydrolysing)